MIFFSEFWGYHNCGNQLLFVATQAEISKALANSNKLAWPDHHRCRYLESCGNALRSPSAHLYRRFNVVD